MTAANSQRWNNAIGANIAPSWPGFTIVKAGPGTRRATQKARRDGRAFRACLRQIGSGWRAAADLR
jgi:hypothetical protein